MAATWPTPAAAVADTWPTVDDLLHWIRYESVTPTSNDVVAGSFAAADQLLRDRIDPELIALKAERAGIIIDPDDVDYDEAVLHAWCPAYVRQAILIRAAAIYTRRDSANGTISFGEFASRVKAADPDVEELIAPVSWALVR